jgi:hypothetical protein
MIEIVENRSSVLSRLFRSFQWNYLPDAILDGYIGRAYTDSATSPHIAMLSIPNLRLSIYGGDCQHPTARTNLEQLAAGTALLFAEQDWEQLAQEVIGGRLLNYRRYAFTSEKLDSDHLRDLSSQTPRGYRLEKMDMDLARRLAGEESPFSADHVRNFGSPERFIQCGFGFCLLAGDEIVSAATTFVVCNKGIEIQINTREQHRGRGLATVGAANLLLLSLEQNLDPNWDAANDVSVRLAKKLGYTPQGTYSMFFYPGDPA